MGSIISGIFGGGSSPGQEGQMQALKASRNDIQQLRPELMQAKLNALKNMTDAYRGTNNALETLWGDPNAKPARVGGQPQQPQRMFGHDMPQGPMPQPGPQQGPPQPGQQPRPVLSQVFDPAGVFKGIF